MITFKNFFFDSISFLIFIFLLLGCDKKNNSSPEFYNNEVDTSSITPAESFALTMVDNFIGEEDEDLSDYLENEIYPLVSKSEKVIIDKISTSLYILTYIENGNEKNFLIEKFYNPIKDEVSFSKKEINQSARKLFLNLENK
ncbi:MAG: hypothetical protein N2490_03620 [Ignavibacteria bacterium]|nr:hypothetical protein [Ignavibacteria bacterium]